MWLIRLDLAGRFGFAKKNILALEKGPEFFHSNCGDVRELNVSAAAPARFFFSSFFLPLLASPQLPFLLEGGGEGDGDGER